MYFQREAVCCSVLQCVAVCCSVLQCVAVCCSVLQCVAGLFEETSRHLRFICIFKERPLYPPKNGLIAL